MYAIRSYYAEQLPSGLRILIAEDEPINFELLKAILPPNVLITWAQDGQEAIDKALSMTFDIVLMDLKMPVKTGYQALKEIKSQQPGLPVVAQTAYAMDGEKDSILHFGFDGYLSYNFV